MADLSCSVGEHHLSDDESQKIMKEFFEFLFFVWAVHVVWESLIQRKRQNAVLEDLVRVLKREHDPDADHFRERLKT